MAVNAGCEERIVNICVEQNTVEAPEGANCADVLKLALSGKRFKACVAVRANGELLDLAAPLPDSVRNGSTALEPVTLDSDEGIDILRHSAAHVMAAAATKPDLAAAAKGQVTYARYCASCHGPEARGDGPVAADLRVPPPDLTALSARSGGAEAPHYGWGFDRLGQFEVEHPHRAVGAAP